ncbi:RDD family protein [Piscinibacter sakaiensis]|uniref:RDD family protein n=1 Tax=Piscinibacter sakaiensis TaxID=1547922 RepID=UPI003AAAD612
MAPTSPEPRPPAVPPSPPTTPGVWRRMACFIYEGVLLFGVLMIAAYLFGTLTQQRHALLGRHGLMAFLFLVLGIYFVWFWSDGRQTVAMRAWHIRLVDRAGAPISQLRALARYVLSYLWFMPALLGLWLSGLRGPGVSFAIILAGVVAYALLARLHPQRQFFHDAICGTCLVDARPPDRR